MISNESKLDACAASTQAPRSIKVGIVDDNSEVREGLCFLVRQSPQMSCVASWQSGEEALANIQNNPVDVVLMDIGLPGMSGIECLARIKTILPQTQIMMITVFEDNDRIFKSLKAGATGYLLKTEPPEKMREAIMDLYAGGSPMSNQIARRVVQEFHKNAPQGPAWEELTHREQEILHQLARGLLYKEIAENLGISIETVRTHIRNIYEKLHVHSRTEALNKVFPR